MKMFGLYRLSFGAEIIESFFDYETNSIGPYKIPINIEGHADRCAGNSIATYLMYELLQKDTEILAIFNNNNFCFCLVYADRIQMKPFFPKDAEKRNYVYKTYYYEQPFKLPNFRHIGFVKTYSNCKAVYHWPWYLIQDVDSGNIPGFEDKVIGEPLVNPPLTLYKELIKQPNAKGVYYNMETMSPVFIN